MDEFRVDSVGYSAQDGGSTGAQIKLVSKAGADGWHGSLFEYFRNDKLQARNYFDPSDKAELRMNQFGASAGGDFIKDKLFAFASFEELKQRAGLNIFENVPSAEARDRAVPEVAPLLEGMPLGTTSTSDPDISQAARRPWHGRKSPITARELIICRRPNIACTCGIRDRTAIF